jgi:hypothetical protein
LADNAAGKEQFSKTPQPPQIPRFTHFWPANRFARAAAPAPPAASRLSSPYRTVARKNSRRLVVLSEASRISKVVEC